MINKCKHLGLLFLFLSSCDNKQFDGKNSKAETVNSPHVISAELDDKSNDEEETIYFPHNISGAYLYCRQEAAYQQDSQTVSVNCRISQSKDGEKSKNALLETIDWELEQTDESKKALCTGQIRKLDPGMEWHIHIQFTAASLEDWRQSMPSYLIHATLQGVGSKMPLVDSLIQKEADEPPELFEFHASPVDGGIQLQWQASLGFQVLIARWNESAPLSESPKTGSLYEGDSPLGNGKVIFLGEDIQWLDQELEVGEAYSYKVWLRRPNSRKYHETKHRLHFAKSCQDLYLRDPGLPSQDYQIYPSGFENSAPGIMASCDMQFDGGGWTLVLNYVRASGNNSDLQIKSSSLPLFRPASLLGDDESSLDPYWGHAGNSMLNSLEFTTIRFWCTADHGRTIHFHAIAPGCVEYFKSGAGNCGDLEQNRSLYADDNSTMVLQTFRGNQGDLALTTEPFYQSGTSHWNINSTFSESNANRWECDNAFADLNTMHRIWVR